MPDHISVFVSASLVSGLAGLAALLRSDSSLTILRVVSALLNTALMGLAVSMLWYNQFIESPHILVGICVLLGLGGQPSIDFLLRLLMRGGLTISFGGGTLRVDAPKSEAETKNADHE